MARRNPAGSGPGRGSPRSRTAARPGERSQRERRSPTAPSSPASPDFVEEDTEGLDAEPVRPQRPTGGVTWRLVVLVVTVLGVALLLAQSLRIYFQQAQEIADVRADIARAEAEIAEQRDELERWQDPEYVRSQARSRLGWVMPGEIGYRVIGADGQPIDGSETLGDEEEVPTGPWYERMWRSVEVADMPVEPEESEGPDAAPTSSPTPDDHIIGTESPAPSDDNS